MRRFAVLPAVGFLLLAAVAAAQEGDLSFRDLDVSMLTARHAPRFGPRLGAPGTGALVEHQDADDYDLERRAFIELDQLVDLIRENVESASWDDYGEIDARGRRILVRNRGHVLRKVEEFLKEAETAAARRVLFDVKVVSIGGGGTASGADMVEAAKSGTLLESGSAETYPGIRSSLKVTNRVRYVRDYDVEIAQTASIADPVVGSAEEGLSIDLVPHPTLDGKRVLVEALVRRGTFDRPFRQLDLSDSEGKLGTVDLPTFRHVAAFSTDVVESGGTLALPFVSEAGSIVVLIRPRVLGQSPARFLDVGAICRTPYRYTVGTPPEVERSFQPLVAPEIGWREEDRPFDGIEGLLELTVTQEDPGYWEEDEGRISVVNESVLFVKANEEILGRVRSFLEAREKEVLRPIRLDLRVYSVQGGVEAGVQPSFEVEGAELLRSGRVSALPGRSALLLAGNTMNYVADYDVAVAQEAQIADPIVGQSFEGLAANLTPRLSVDGSKVQVEIGLLYAKRSLGKEPTDMGAKYLGVVDGVSEKRTVFNESVELPAGSVYVFDGGPDPDSRGRLAIVLGAKLD